VSVSVGFDLEVTPMRYRAPLSPACVLLLAVLLTAFAWAPPARADWVAAGPQGGSILALAVDPGASSTLYAGSDGGGVWKSTDAGATWGWAGLGLGNIQALALAIDPQTPATVYAGTEAGVFKSVDAGATWTPANDGLTEPVILQLAIDPLHPETVYAGTLSGLFASADSGTTWKAVAGPFASVGLLAIDPQHPATLYVGPFNAAGLYKSTDAGATWKDESAVLGGGAVTAVALVLDPAAPSKVYAAVRTLFDNVGSLFTSASGGASWVRAGRGLEGRAVLALAAAPRGAALYAATDLGLYTSADSGKSWKRVGPKAPSGPVFAVALAAGSGRRPGAVYAGTLDLGVWKSADGGRSFAASNQGLLAISVLDLALSPGALSTLYVRSPGGQIWRSGDGGGSFALASRLPIVSAQGLAADPNDPAVAYAGLHGHIAKSTDSGKTWQIEGGDIFGNVESGVVAVDPRNSANVYIAGQPSEFRDPRCAAFRSADSGASWICMPTLGPLIQDLAIAPSAPATLYAITAFGVQKSTDHGASWKVTNHGLEAAAPLALAVDPTAPSTVYAAAESGLFKTTDGGGSWVYTSAGLPVAQPKQLVRFTSVAVDPGNPRVIYIVAAIYSSRSDPPRLRIFRSTDAAATFALWSNGLPRVTAATRLVVDPRHPGTVYLGTYGRGVYRWVP
jgi:photosystem II stability/assembly factor-like uncharacterized protein